MRTFVLVHQQARERAVAAVREADAGMVVQIKAPGRTSAENALLHVLISDIAKQAEWAGKKRDTECWKRLLVAAWCRVKGEPLELLPSLDGHGFDILPARTSALSKRDCASLIEYIYFWGAENGIAFSEAPIDSP